METSASPPKHHFPLLFRSSPPALARWRADPDGARRGNKTAARHRRLVAFKVVFLEPGYRGVGGGEGLDVLAVANLLAVLTPEGGFWKPGKIGKFAISVGTTVYEARCRRVAPKRLLGSKYDGCSAKPICLLRFTCA